MLKKILSLMLILLLSVSLFGCMVDLNGGRQQQEEQSQDGVQGTPENDKAAVTRLVEDFGSRLQKVSLSAPEDVVEKSIKENYGALVSPTLLEKWLNDPAGAPGRITSSPWPDRIEIQSIDQLSEDAYKVEGEVVEVTSVEKEKGGAAARKPIMVVVKKTEGRWFVDDVTFDAYAEPNSIVYRNTEYGFTFSLPESWKGYLLVTDKWEGRALKGSQSGEIVESGPIISLRHPQWTEKEPRQDIPVMIFTLEQWQALQQEKFSVGAAPIGPKELACNSKYVFSLPARYNYAFPTGYEEVEKILEGNPLKANENFE